MVMPLITARLKSIEERADEVAKKLKFRKVLLQLPEGLLWQAPEISSSLEKRGYEIIISGRRCFGACDIAAGEASSTGAECILHVGHKPFYRSIESPVPVIYYEWPVEFDIDMEAFAAEAEKIREDRIGVITSVQFIDAAKRIADMLNRNGKKAEYGGYVLGCWTEAPESLVKKGYETIMFVGSGVFHPLGFGCKYVFDLEHGMIRDISEEQLKWEKRRMARIMKAQEAQRFGILVSTKNGQNSLLGKAADIKAMLEKSNKKAFIIVMDEINTEALSHMKVDAFVNTACPRIADDRWEKPLINADELHLVLEK